MSKNHRSTNQEAILKLIKLTSNSHVEWAETDKDLIVLKETTDDEIIGKAFKANYKDLLFRIFKYRKYGGVDEINLPYWDYFTKLEIVDEKQEAIWEFPDTSSLADLYDTVSFKVAGGEKIYNILLAE